MKKQNHHSKKDIVTAVSLFFAVRRIMRTEFAKEGKHDPSLWMRVEALKFIQDNHNPLMKEFADYFSITAPSATSLVSGLARDGLVIHSADSHDRRASRLIITSKGRATFKRIIAKGIKVQKRIFSTLSKKELAELTNALKCIKNSSF